MIEHKGIKPKYCNSMCEYNKAIMFKRQRLGVIMTRKRQASPGSVNTPWLEWAMNYINSVSPFK